MGAAAASPIRVIGIGDNVVDNYVHLRKVFPGGNALNFAVFASGLGCHAAYLGVFGNDKNAEHLQQTLREKGVDISRCQTADGPNGEALLTIEGGERIFLSSNQGGVAKSVPMDFIFEDRPYLESFSLIHTSAYSYMDACLPKLYGLHPMISYDFSDDFTPGKALSLCRHIDFAFFSCSGWTEKATRIWLRKAVEQGCILATATRGPQDVLLFNGREWFRQAPLSSDPVDTLGAGDAFITAFLVSLLENTPHRTAPAGTQIENALGKAAAFAAEVCQLRGAFGHGRSY